MKRSGQVGLVLMGAATFVATFAGGMAYFGWQKQSHAAQAQSVTDQSCTPRPDGTRNCEPQRRSISYYIYPRWVSGWSWGWSSSPEPYGRTQSAALSNNSRSHTPSSPAAGGSTTRGGFGSTAGSGSYRVSAGG